jgi:hypothetical protein
MLILFGGGDGGGISVGGDGTIHRIPPWNPETMLELKAVSALVGVATLHDGAVTKDAGALAERLSTKVIPKLAKTLGATQMSDNSIAFVDDDGGFVCGSTGKHPIPIPPRPLGGHVISPVTSREAIHV